MIISRHHIPSVLATVILLAQCSDRESGVVTIVLPPEIPPRVTFVVTPDSGRIGTIVSIKDTSLQASWLLQVTFSGADGPLYVRCDTAGTITTFVPFGAITGPITIPIPGAVGVTPAFVVNELPDTFGFAVGPYDIVPPVTASDSVAVDFLGIRRPWIADVNSDTVHIWRSWRPGDDGVTHHMLLRDRGPNVFPDIISVWTTRSSDYPGISIDTVRTGILKVQNWDVNGIMSGRFFGTPSLRDIVDGTLRFWIDRTIQK